MKSWMESMLRSVSDTRLFIIVRIFMSCSAGNGDGFVCDGSVERLESLERF